MIATFVVLTRTTGMVSGVAAAAGEEIGRRGFLVPELARVLPFTGVALVSGLIWARRRDVTAPVDNSSAPAH